MDGVAQAYALEEADGDEKKARAYYTKHRVRRIRDMITQEDILRKEQEEEARFRENQKKADEQIAALNAKIKKEEEEKKVALQKAEQKAEQKAKEDKAAKDKASKEGRLAFFFVFLFIFIVILLGGIFG